MEIRVLAFAGVREILGGIELRVDLPDGATLADLRAALDAAHPELEPYWERLAVAVDGRLGNSEMKLSPGCEVALLPPVSGGSGSGGGPSANVLVEQPIDREAVIARVATRARGAVLVFEGTVRDSHQSRPVTHLVYDAYRAMADETLRRIAREIEAAGRDLAVEIVHRLGEVRAGEASVVIAVGSPHRDAAYGASREALERLKSEVPIWKREYYADGDNEWREDKPLGTRIGKGISCGSAAIP